MPTESLTTELDYYRTRQDELLCTHPGQFALIRRQRLIGIFRTAVQAYAAQLEQFPFGPSLVKQIAAESAVATATLTGTEHDVASLTIERDALAILVEQKQRRNGTAQPHPDTTNRYSRRDA